MNPEISGKKLEIVSKRYLGVALDGFCQNSRGRLSMITPRIC